MDLRDEERKVRDFEPQLYNRVSDNLYYQGINEFGGNYNQRVSNRQMMDNYKFSHATKEQYNSGAISQIQEVHEEERNSR